MFHVGDVVRKLRLALGWTIPELADRAGVNKATVSGIERGENHTRDTLDAIAHALGCSEEASLESRLDTWAEARVGPVALRPDWHRLISFWEQLAPDPDAQRLLLALIEREARYVSQHGATDAVKTPASLRPQRKGRRALRQKTAPPANYETATTSTTLRRHQKPAAADGEPPKGRAGTIPENRRKAAG